MVDVAAETARRQWRLDVPARTMSDADIAAEIMDRQREWGELRAALDECGGMSGSPGEWLWERMGELEAEQQRRIATDA